ncbi:MAG: BrxE family protein [Muribaculaceae bacterium]|nr:BrxE family protein [Muribaculaceae bacterium]
MSDQNILEIIRLRWAIYYLGAETGLWRSLSDEDVKGFMEFLFPKSRYIAQYNLMLNVVRNSEPVKDVPIGSYSLFKFPEQIEEKVLDYLKQHADKDYSQLEESPEIYLKQLGTIPSDANLFDSSVGRLDVIGINDMLRILAYRYYLSFTGNTHNFPYFE